MISIDEHSRQFCSALAAQVREALENTAYLSFDGAVEEGAIATGGRPEPFRTLVRTRVWMRPDRIRLELSRAADVEPVIFHVNDGRRIVQWTADEWAETPSQTPGCEIYVGTSLSEECLGCLVGWWLSTWAGVRTPHPGRFFEYITDGRYLGVDCVEGRPCHTVLQEVPRELTPDMSLIIRRWHAIDVESRLPRRIKISQAVQDAQMRLVQDVTRVKTMHNLCTEPFADSIFKAEPPASARKIEVPARPTSAPANEKAASPTEGLTR